MADTPAPLVPPDGWARFEHRARLRRIDKRAEAARVAIARRRFGEAEAAMADIRELDPSHPDLISLSIEMDAARARPSGWRGAWLAAAAVFVSLTAAGLWWFDATRTARSPRGGDAPPLSAQTAPPQLQPATAGREQAHAASPDALVRETPTQPADGGDAGADRRASLEPQSPVDPRSAIDPRASIDLRAPLDTPASLDTPAALDGAASLDRGSSPSHPNVSEQAAAFATTSRDDGSSLGVRATDREPDWDPAQDRPRAPNRATAAIGTSRPPIQWPPVRGPVAAGQGGLTPAAEHEVGAIVPTVEPVTGDLPDVPPPVPAGRATGSPGVMLASTAPAVLRVRDEELVQRVLQRYRLAYETLDARSARTVWPSVDQGALQRAFDGLESQQLTFADCTVEVRGVAGAATCRGTARYVPKVGSRDARVEPRIWRFSLRKAGDEWHIESARAER